MNNQYFKEIKEIQNNIKTLNAKLRLETAPPEESIKKPFEIPKKKELRGNQYALDQFLYQQNYIKYKQNMKKYKTAEDKEIAESKIVKLDGGMDELEKRMMAKQYQRMWTNLGKKQKLFKLKEFVNDSCLTPENKTKLIGELESLIKSNRLKTAREVKYNKNEEKIKSISRLKILSTGDYELN